MATVVTLPVGNGSTIMAGHTPTSIAIPAFVADAGLSVLSRFDRPTQEAWMSALANAATGIVEVQEAARHASREYLGPVGSGSDDWHWRRSGHSDGAEPGDRRESTWFDADPESRHERQERRRERKERRSEAREARAAHREECKEAGEAYREERKAWTKDYEDGHIDHEEVRRRSRAHWQRHASHWDRSRAQRRKRRSFLRRLAARVRDRLVPHPNERLMRAMPWEFREGDRLVLQHTGHIPAPIAQTLLATSALSQRVKSTGSMVGTGLGSLVSFTALSCVPGSSIAGLYFLYRTACHVQARKGAGFVIDAMEDDAIEVLEPNSLTEYVDSRQSAHGGFHVDLTDVGRLAALTKTGTASLSAAFESTLLHGAIRIPPMGSDPRRGPGQGFGPRR